MLKQRSHIDAINISVI